MSSFRPVVLVSHLRPGQEAGYEQAHARIPEDLLATLRRVGVRDWTIWREGTTLLHLVDVDDYAAVEDRLVGDPVNGRWQAEMAAYVDGFDDVVEIPVLASPGLVWSMRSQVRSTVGER